MNLAAGPPQHWLVTVVDGSVVDVWADSVEGPGGPEDQRDYLFGNLMDIAPADQRAFDITATTPANPSRVIVTAHGSLGPQFVTSSAPPDKEIP